MNIPTLLAIAGKTIFREKILVQLEKCYFIQLFSFFHVGKCLKWNIHRFWFIYEQHHPAGVPTLKSTWLNLCKLTQIRKTIHPSHYRAISRLSLHSICLSASTPHCVGLLRRLCRFLWLKGKFWRKTWKIDIY